MDEEKSFLWFVLGAIFGAGIVVIFVFIGYRALVDDMFSYIHHVVTTGQCANDVLQGMNSELAAKSLEFAVSHGLCR